MLQLKAEEQEKEDREHPENKSKPKPAAEKEDGALNICSEFDCTWDRFWMSLALTGGHMSCCTGWLNQTRCRYCCRRMMLTHVDLIEKAAQMWEGSGYFDWLRGHELQYLREAWVSTLAKKHGEGLPSFSRRYQAMMEDDDRMED